MLSAEEALRRSQRLVELGFDMSPRRLQEISAGARPTPDERPAALVGGVIAAIENGITPEAAAAAEHVRVRRNRMVLAALLVAFVVAVLVIALIAAL